MAKLTKRSPAVEDVVRRIRILTNSAHNDKRGGYQLINIPLEDIDTLLKTYDRLYDKQKHHQPAYEIFKDLMKKHITDAIINGGTAKWTVHVPVLGRLALRIRALKSFGPLAKKKT